MNPNFKSNLNFEGFEVSFITETIKTIRKKSKTLILIWVKVRTNRDQKVI